MNAAVLAYRWPALSRWILEHVLTDAAPRPARGRHAAPGTLIKYRPGWARAIARWWRDANADDPEPANLPEFSPITGPTAVSFPRLPVCRVSGKPPWEVTSR